MSHDPNDEEQLEYHSHDDAVRIARSEALRAYDEGPGRISYVSHMEALHDYCLCEFVQEEGGWLQTYRPLTPDERLASEVITEEAILRLAMSGNMVSAVRLYRSKHQVGLKDAYDAMQSLLTVALKKCFPPSSHDA